MLNSGFPLAASHLDVMPRIFPTWVTSRRSVHFRGIPFEKSLASDAEPEWVIPALAAAVKVPVEVFVFVGHRRVSAGEWRSVEHCGETD